MIDSLRSKRAAIRLLAVALLASSAPAAWAKDAPTLKKAIGASDRLKIEGSVRVRFEAIAGQARPGFNDSDELVSLRSTLFAEYDWGPVRIGGEIRDARVYDASLRTPLSTSEVNALEPVQAYIGGNLGNLLGAGSKTTL